MIPCSLEVCVYVCLCVCLSFCLSGVHVSVSEKLISWSIYPQHFRIFFLVLSFIVYEVTSAIVLRFQIDDPLDVFSVHGMGGLFGTLLVGVYSRPELLAIDRYQDVNFGGFLYVNVSFLLFRKLP